jgi:hypothetical protein
MVSLSGRTAAQAPAKTSCPRAFEADGESEVRISQTYIVMYTRLKNYLTQVSKTALGTRAAGHGVTVFPNDIFLVGYFRSGTTWSRFLVGNFVHADQAVTFANIGDLVPSIYEHADRKLRARPRLIKSHESFDARYPRIVHFIRDPRDVAVSLYYYCLKVRTIPDGFPKDDFVDLFLTRRTGSAADQVGTWEDHTLSWFRLRQGRDTYRLVRYEDLLTDPGKELTRIAPLLGVEPTPERIERAIRLSSADRMRSLEKTQSKQWITTKDSRQDIPFVRQAKSGNWQTGLSEESVRKIEQAWGPTIEELGYELSTASRPHRPIVES